MRLTTCIANDLRLQWRAGFYTVYSLIVALYIVTLGALDPSQQRPVVTLMIFIDPSALGFFFLGGLMLFERGDGVLSALFAGPLRVGEYIASKAISLTVLALLSSLVLALGLGLGTHVGAGSLVLMLLGVGLTSTMITFFSIAIGTRLTTVNRYFFGGTILALPLVAPIFDYVGVAPEGLGDALAWLPAAPGLALIDAGLGGAQLSPFGIMRAVALLALWNGLMFLWARRWFERFVTWGQS